MERGRGEAWKGTSRDNTIVTPSSVPCGSYICMMGWAEGAEGDSERDLWCRAERVLGIAIEYVWLWYVLCRI